MTISSGQIAAIHALKSRAGLDDDGYRDVLQQVAGVPSTKALSHGQAGAVIDRLKGLAGQAMGRERGPAAKGAMDLSGPYAPICRALWISAWNLGLVEHREDVALVAFVRRQTRLEHLNWLRSPELAAKVIEALKAWMARDAGVRWPPRGSDDGPPRKLAIIRAQLRLLGEPDVMPPGDFDTVIGDLGRRVREAKAR